MAWFTGSVRRSSPTQRDRHSDANADVRRHRRISKELGTDLPIGFDALIERLVLGGELEGVCAHIGEAAADAGIPLDEILDHVERVYEVVRAGEPPFGLTRTLVMAWSDASLQFLHAMSCEDPLTGLASLPHIRTGLNEAYRLCERRGVDVNERHALVVAEISRAEHATLPLWGGLAMLDSAEALRSAFDDRLTIGRAGKYRVIAIVSRDDQLPQAVAATQELLAVRGTGSAPVEPTRVWIEGLPPTSSAASLLLDELAR